ncbi:hypothetical protein JZ751_012768 [Albula glossodonta]|uniref:Peptidase metallopeptidase domain-containing protein n=1 Tax=Albula glossodonta TaxID=121402 RepID=A0A8T2MYG6_9TELE|nr:hypothetical protein JZ751_012768 [Albula glossodonta]
MLPFCPMETAHGDSYPFDGPRGTLAHAFGPGDGIGGDTHFDDAETWTTGSGGFNLFLVAAHEFGHALGLKHSRNPASLMYPTYKARNPQNVLSKEDTNKINSLYAAAPERHPRPRWSPRLNPWFLGRHFPFLLQDKCSPDLAFDAVTSLGETVLFFKDNYWTVRRSQVKGRPKPIHRFGLPKHLKQIDAVVHINTTGHTLFFTQDLYWRYNENRKAMADSYPRSTSDDFPGIKTPVDAAVYKNGFIHFFHGPKVYKFDDFQKSIVGIDKANSWLGGKVENKCFDSEEIGMWPWVAVLYLLGNMDVVWSLPIAHESRVSQEDIRFAENKLREMQSFFGLEVTGHLDRQTLAEMKSPRCGVPDVENYSFYPDKPKWKNRTITYRISKYTPDLRREEVETSFRLALKMWSNAAPLRFVKVDHHGDFFPFDGPKGVLAHAFEPGEDMGGDIHFDEDEIWTMGYRSWGYNLFTVAAHELGHSLGLAHSRDPSALMYPTYKYNDMIQYTLPMDDTIGIQALYGSPNSRKQQNLLRPEKCDPNLSFDAIAQIGEEMVFFKNRYVWLRTTWAGQRNKLREGLSSTYLPGIISPVDAAYSDPTRGVAYIFTGPKYWVVQKLNTKSHFGSIYDFGFPARIKKIDAAVHIPEFGKTYFFVGDVYYRYDEDNSAIDPGFPRSISTNWPGIGRKIDAAFELSGPSLLALLFFGLCQAAPTPGPDYTPSAEEQTEAENYLSQFYGDVGTTNSTFRRIVVKSFENDLETMQSFFGLEVTGKLDKKTLDVMKAPRCGVSDIGRYGHFHGKPKWKKTTITYRITQYTPDLSRSAVDATIAKAFKLYSDVTPLNFQQITSGTADIMILFKNGCTYHGDFYPFDGPNGVLAHANSPGIEQGGDTHFDEDENWTLTQNGVNLLLVAAHEFGHALGLDHSRDREALMFPTYQYVDTKEYQLPQDDGLIHHQRNLTPRQKQILNPHQNQNQQKNQPQSPSQIPNRTPGQNPGPIQRMSNAAGTWYSMPLRA